MSPKIYILKDGINYTEVVNAAKEMFVEYHPPLQGPSKTFP